MARTVVAIFNDYHSAENAARQIKDQGLRTEDISIVAKQGEAKEHTGDAGIRTTATGRAGDIAAAGTTTGGMNTIGTKDRPGPDNVSDGVITGGVLGALAGLLIGAGSMMIPGLGIIAAAGPVTGLLSGAVTGGIVGGLVDLGIPEDNSRQYESDIKSGKILFSMKAPDNNIDRVADILRRNGAIKVDMY